MANPYQQILRQLPSVDSLLSDPELQGEIAEAPRAVAVSAIRRAIEQCRDSLIAQPGEKIEAQQTHERIISAAKQYMRDGSRSFYRKAINATGIILHTALGRAPLAVEAIKQIEDELSNYSLLQVDTETGKRSRREEGVEQLLQELTGAEAATVVNNNAAATAIVLNTVAQGREVIVSRGQLVEIGGSFRLPEIMAFSKAKLIEVGATNKTHPRDYENAITEETVAILRVHPSNYKIEGFSSEVPLETLADIAHRHGLIVIDDVGAGSLVDFSQFGFEPEPTLPQSIHKGADIVTSSADKLIGASQAGIILGKKQHIDAIRKNQFARIVRVGKLTLAALEATLKLFGDESQALEKVPILRMLMTSKERIAEKAEQIAKELKTKLSEAKVEVSPGYSQMGSGSLPTQNLATTLVTIKPNKMTVEALARALRQYEPPVFTRIHKDRVCIDPRTVAGDEQPVIVQALSDILSSKD